MKTILKFTACLFLSAIIFCISCKKEKSCSGCKEINKPPIAIAGPEQVITLPTESVSLDGSSSSDPDGTISSFQWTKISGPASFSIITPLAARTTVKQLVIGVYQFELKITDNGGLCAKDTIQITFNDAFQPNRPPVASAGVDQTITISNNTVTLDGSASTDPDNNITSYVWAKISGPTSFNIANAGEVQAQVAGLVQGVYQFELKVTDAGGLFSKDTVQLEIINSLSGYQIIYNGGWGCNDLCRDGDVYWDSSPWSGNLYSNPDIPLEVSIRLDSSSVWIDVHKINSPLPPTNQFYWQIDRGYLWVFAYEGRLIRTPVTIKVKFI